MPRCYGHIRGSEFSPLSMQIMALTYVAADISCVFFGRGSRGSRAVGNKMNMILPGGSRQNIPFHITGIGMFEIGVPFITFFGVLVVMVKTYFRRVPDAFFEIVLGTSITLGGAIGIETLANFVGHNPTHGILQVISEELCEVIGGTIVLWGSYDVLYRYRFAFTVDEVELK